MGPQLAINFAVALFGLAGVLGRLSDLPPLVIVLGRVGFGGLALLALAGVRRSNLRAQSRHLPLFVGQGIILALHWTLFFQSILVSSVAIGLLSFATFPVFAAALEALLLGTRPNRLQLAAALCIVIGVAILAPPGAPTSTTTQGVLWGLAAAASFALLSVLNRRLRRQYTSLVISLYQDCSAAVVLLPVLIVVPAPQLLEVRALIILVALGVLCTAVAHTLFIASLRHMSAVKASLFASLEPVWGILFAALLLGEVPMARSLVGGAIIVGATLLPAVWQRRATID